MKLYLSSLGIPDPKAYQRLFGKHKGRIAVIATAWNVAPAEKSRPFIEHVIAALTDMGFIPFMLDLRDYDGKTDALAEKFADCSGVWVTGGNTFYLSYHMHQSGFDTLLPHLLRQGFVYAGESAGAVIAGKTLHGIEVLDDPSLAPETIWEGLCLVDYGIIPHWGKPKYAGRSEQAYEEMRLFGPVKTLTDDQYIHLPSSYLTKTV
jgi:dipeptidase E